jgi:hypothetical protein
MIARVMVLLYVSAKVFAGTATLTCIVTVFPPAPVFALAE